MFRVSQKYDRYRHWLGPGLCLIAVVVFGAFGFGCDGTAKKPAFTGPMTFQGQSVTAQQLNRGHEVYRLYCSSCHGEDGSGKGPASSSMTIKPRDFRSATFGETQELPTHDQLVEMISMGKPERGMPSWRGFSKDDLNAVAHYIKTFSKRWQSEASSTSSTDTKQEAGD